MSYSGSSRGRSKVNGYQVKESGWKQVQVLRMGTWVRIWTLLLNTVEYHQHLISISVGVLRQTSRTPGQDAFVFSVSFSSTCLHKWGMASSAACKCGAEEQTVDLRCPPMSNPSTSSWTARPDGYGRWDNRMAAQDLPRDLVPPSSGLKELAQTTKKKLYVA